MKTDVFNTMIDQDQTIREFGYNPNIFSDGSHKLVIAVCPSCGKTRSLAKRDSDSLCYSCRSSGSRNGMFGKKHTDSAKEKMREAKADVTMETRKKISENHADVSGKNNPMFGIHRFGKDATFYGRTTSDEAKQKISKANSGRIPTQETRKKMRENTVGKNNPNWRGGISSFRQNLNNTDEYKQWRLSVFQRDNFTCRKCGSTKSGSFNAHHILPVRDWRAPQFTMNVKNGITLCKGCHEQTFGKEYEFFAEYFDLANGVIK